MQRTVLARGTGVLLAAVLAATLGVGRLQETLYTPTFLTGWLLALPVGLAALAWWRIPSDATELARRVRRQLVLAALALFLFGVHVELELPVGWIETALFALLVAFLASTLSGSVLLADADDPEERDRRAEAWLRLHVPIVWSLLALGVFHGVFVHLHGLLAHLVLYAGEAS